MTEASKEVLNERIKKALDSSEFAVELENLKQQKQVIKSKTKEANLSKKNREELEKEVQDVNSKIDAELKALEEKSRQEQAQEEAQLLDSGGAATKKVQANVKGGCFPGSSTFVDKDGCLRAMKSLQIGEHVQVFANEGIRLEPVITFIHREPKELQEFLSITTTENNNLKITEDHLLFVEKKGQAIAIPAREVKIGDTVFVKQNDDMKTGLVQDISSVFEKGVYAPVTLSGTLLVNDVHTSCYFDVLSHEWSHRAMGAARVMYHVSPWMLQRLSGVGEKDGFPGWCRLAQKILTWLQ